jgi:hypothetical protein
MDYLVKEIPTTEAETAPTQVPEQSPLFRWLTGEVLIYTLIVLAAAGLRFANLGAYPLNDAEAAQALVGYDVSQGHIPAEAGLGRLRS